MNDHELAAIGAGFGHEAFGSQVVFRAALQALSHPGRPVCVAHDAELPKHGHGAAAVLWLALLDADCSLWLSPSLAGSDAAAWLRFHTGCRIVTDAAQAQFVWVGQGDTPPALDRLRRGSDAYPDQSATCVIEVAQLDAVEGFGAWTLSGPGIRERASLQVTGLPDDFPALWADNHAAFPRGVDLFLGTATHLVGLPRTTRINNPREA